ncbi:MAG: tRNA wyosine derivatives biosynthesis protein Taw2 [Methanomassiliicoccales archaeon PtaU1.Bin124]|nr:MAG: tRNA wyosine derivatives biosynthesis protein Taw2 [Methanomassiliicoccales archaeon PtaU1.Bin124]
MRCIKVPRDMAEQVREKLNRQGMVVKERCILDRDEWILIPLHEGEVPAEFSKFELVEEDPAPRETFRKPMRNIRGMLDLDDSLLSILPEKWEMLGNVIIFRLPAELEPYGPTIAEAYAKELNAKAVVQEVGVISGVTRRPATRLLYGTDTVTVHPEGGIFYKLDPTQVMFSSGNFEEKRRMAALDCRGETVVDMFAGIGYFTLPLAKRAHAKEVIACEINPVSHRFLCDNVRLNGLDDVIRPVLGDNRDLPGERFADRVLMGYVGTTEQFLPKALQLVRPGGIVHYHDVAGVEEIPGKLLDAIRNACACRKYEVVGWHSIKSYGPCREHLVVDFRVLD